MIVDSTLKEAEVRAMRSNDNGSPPGSGGWSREEQVGALVAHYVDLLNAGKDIDPEQISRDHPDLAPDVLQELETFVEFSSPFSRGESLGTLGDYVLRRQIGRGGMGVVYEAWENSMDRRVALKVLPAGVAADNNTYIRFMREAKTAGQLSHQNVVHVYAMGVKERTPYYAMEYVEGETLAQILARWRALEGNEEQKTTILQSISQLFGKNSPLTPEDTAETERPEAESAVARPFGEDENIIYFGRLAEAFVGVADGLQHAHSKGVVHRDIKPSNLILDDDGHLRILDFGLARLEGQESLTLSGDLMGTVLYMSPEQAMAKRIPLDHRTDIYSLGATMYEMLTWEPPETASYYTMSHRY